MTNDGEIIPPPPTVVRYLANHSHSHVPKPPGLTSPDASKIPHSRAHLASLSRSDDPATHPAAGGPGPANNEALPPPPRASNHPPPAPQHAPAHSRHALHLTTLRSLLWPPLPWTLAVPSPISYTQLQASPSLIDARQPNIRTLFEIPLFRARDSPLRSLYRAHDDLCAGRLTLLAYECEYLFRRGGPRWRLSALPDPADLDPVRYAVLASMAEALVCAFNWKLEFGIRRGGEPCDQSVFRATNFEREEPPAWTRGVPRTQTRVDLVDHVAEPSTMQDECFLKRNIEATTGYLYTV